MAMKRTYQPKKLHRQKVHGFMKRMSTKTAAKSSPQEEQRAESTSATDKPPLCCRFCMKDGAAWRGANGKTIRGDL